jgi:hypothetical protein
MVILAQVLMWREEGEKEREEGRCSLIIFLFYYLHKKIGYFFNFVNFVQFLAIDYCDGVTCGGNATCLSSIGSYNCLCNRGFSGDGYNCTGNNRSEGRGRERRKGRKVREE